MGDVFAHSTLAVCEAVAAHAEKAVPDDPAGRLGSPCRRLDSFSAQLARPLPGPPVSVKHLGRQIGVSFLSH